MPKDAPEKSAVKSLHGVAPRRTIDGERLILVFSHLVEPIGRALPSSSEVVLHDLSSLPNSIVAVYGDVTGRRIGDPATDLLLEQAMLGFPDHNLGYDTKLSDGRRMRSSTMIIRDVANNPVAALCINTDVSAWLGIQQLANAMIQGSAAGSPPMAPQAPPGLASSGSSEVFARDIDELASHLIHQAIVDVGIPVSEMKKSHKVAVVSTLRSRGIFMLREAVEMIAEALDVTRFTIYNYLNGLPEQTTGDAAPPR